MPFADVSRESTAASPESTRDRPMPEGQPFKEVEELPIPSSRLSGYSNQQTACVNRTEKYTAAFRPFARLNMLSEDL
jgi:hypothetical protein